MCAGRNQNASNAKDVVGGLISGTREVVGDAGGFVRALQSGFVRSYALLLIFGFAGLALYFLIQQS